MIQCFSSASFIVENFKFLDVISFRIDSGKDLDIFSLETVKMFFDDAKKAGYSI